MRFKVDEAGIGQVEAVDLFFFGFVLSAVAFHQE